MRFLDGYAHVDAGEDRLRVTLQIADDSARLTREDETLASWRHPKWGAEQVAPDRFQVSFDGEEFEFAPDNLLEFKYEVMPELAAHQELSRRRRRHWSRRAAVPAAVGISIVVLALLARSALAAVASLLGALVLLVAIFALLDSEVASRFSARWTPNRVLLVGLGMLVGGGLLATLA